MATILLGTRKLPSHSAMIGAFLRPIACSALLLALQESRQSFRPEAERCQLARAAENSGSQRTVTWPDSLTVSSNASQTHTHTLSYLAGHQTGVHYFSGIKQSPTIFIGYNFFVGPAGAQFFLCFEFIASQLAICQLIVLDFSFVYEQTDSSIALSVIDYSQISLVLTLMKDMVGVHPIATDRFEEMRRTRV